MWPRLHDQRPFLVVATSLVALMWLSLWWWGQSPNGRFLSHEELGHADGIAGGYATLVLLFVAGWTLMTVAMMLPTSLPLVALFYAFVRAREDGCDSPSSSSPATWPCGRPRARRPPRRPQRARAGAPKRVARGERLGDRAATVLLAGAYQFAPLKYRCLEKCRSPLSFVMGATGTGDAARARRSAWASTTVCTAWAAAGR